MSRSNFLTMLFLCLCIIFAVLLLPHWIQHDAGSDITDEAPGTSFMTTPEGSVTREAAPPSTEATMPPGTAPTVVSTDSSNATSSDFSLDDALFIGDSRTVGLMEYAQIAGADFFCATGMSVFNVRKEAVSVPGVGRLTLSQLLDGKSYGKIFIMLGINELGYPFSSIVSKYEELIEYVRITAPDAVILLQGNLHVTKSRSDSDSVYNNKAIDRLNSALSLLADQQSIFYLDANTLFDDADGALSSDKSSDQTHLYGKYYAQWGQWIIGQTEALIGKG